MCTKKELEFSLFVIYQLAENQNYDVIIGSVADDDVFKTVDIYYRSRLAEQISQGMYGIENMDYKYLVQDMIENEPEIFS